MDSVFRIEGKRLIRRYDAEQLWVEPWGANSLRVRATELAVMQEEDWALLPQETSNVQISVVGQTASIQNGNIRAEISAGGRLTFFNRAGKVLLQEYVRNRADIQEYKSALNIEATRIQANSRRRLQPDGAFRVRSRRENIRYGSVSTAVFGFEKLYAGACAAEFAGQRAVCPIQFGLRLSLEQSCGRPSDVREKLNGMGSRLHEAVGLLDYRWRYAGVRSKKLMPG